MSRLLILPLGPDCNPEKVGVPFVTDSHAAIVAQLRDVILVDREAVEDPLRCAKPPFRVIEVVRTQRLDRIFAWSFCRIFKCNYDTPVMTAFRYPFSLLFEWRARRQLRRRIFAGEFDVAECFRARDRYAPSTKRVTGSAGHADCPSELRQRSTDCP